MFEIQTHKPISRDAIARQVQGIGITLDSAQVDNLHAAFIAHRAELFGLDRLDASETAILGALGQLEFMRQRENDRKRPVLKGRLLVPVTHEVPPGATSASYSTWDERGMAELIANPADDVHMVGVEAEKFLFDLYAFGAGYQFSVDEIEAAAFSGTPLQSKLAKAKVGAFERRVEAISASGHPGTALTGLLNHASVPLIQAAAAAGGANAPAWDGADKTPAEILTDLLTMEDTIITQSNEVEAPTTLALPLTHLRIIQNTELAPGTGAPATETILKVFLDRSQSVTDVEAWLPCALADAAGTGPRACMYRRHPDVVHHEIPLEPTEYPPQAVNFAMKVLSRMKSGGVWWEYPLAGIYMDAL